MTSEDREQGIAIVGMSGRFPGAADVETFWRNIRDGQESIAFYSDEELQAAGIDERILRDPSYVKASGALDEIELFDAGFFEYTPREAEMLDPQQRIFLECAWHALEHAGYDPATYGGLIGVYAGSNISTYLLVNLASNPELVASFSGYQTIIANDKDYLPTRVSYKLNLRGPSLNINTACSTSLVAVHIACQSLLNGECDLALAGGVSITVPQRVGYWYREGGVSSPDGHCRAFDAAARGTVDGSGVGIVVLRRLEDALNDGDTIHAIIRGSAINNDGAGKVGFTAPSVDGQAAVIEEALAVAGVVPDMIDYVEAHGTGTPLGDPIEIAALTQVFRAKTDGIGCCAVGSVKTNIGHLGAAAGVAGLIKAVQALKHRQIPPSLHFERPNPRLDLARSPFYVSARLHDWPERDEPRRAGVSSFGIGGTNAHVVLEAAPVPEPADPGRPWHLLPLSAKTSAALDAATANLLALLKATPDVSLADVAYTLQVGRQAFDHRRMLVCRDRQDALDALEQMHPERVLSRVREPGARSVVFLFPGQGAQYPNMARELYEVEPKFRATVDRCCALLRPHLHPEGTRDLRAVLFPDDETRAAEDLSRTRLTQPALFVIEYALARLLMAWGIKPQAMIGHSIGEYVAATLAGVFSLEDALALVALRGRLIDELPSGAMLSVPLPEHEVLDLLDPQLALAAVNGPSLCVVSGAHGAIDALHERLIARGVDCRRLHTSHAFHSAMMSPIMIRFAEQVGKFERKAPKIPYISNVTGTWITAAAATDPEYWARHLRQTVRFADGLQTLLGPDGTTPGRILLEVGPGRTLSTLAQQQPGRAGSRIVLSSMRHPQDQQADEAFLLNSIGKLWLLGVPVSWPALYAGAHGAERRYRVPLPLYAFDRQRYWVAAQQIRPIASEPVEPTAAPEATESSEAVPFSLHPRPDLLTTYVPPGSKLERKIAAIWQELLGVEQIGIHDNFFDLGGHSLMATQVLSRLRQIFQIDLPLERMFETTTIAQLAEMIQDELILKLEALPEEEAQLLLETLED
ncbi:MAG TPA: beta-ketoacyl synthase N-terminal-like domain-containing protein [Herpetosiphonaceae bacterium]